MKKNTNTLLNTAKKLALLTMFATLPIKNANATNEQKPATQTEQTEKSTKSEQPIAMACMLFFLSVGVACYFNADKITYFISKKKDALDALLKKSNEKSR